MRGIDAPQGTSLATARLLTGSPAGEASAYWDLAFSSVTSQLQPHRAAPFLTGPDPQEQRMVSRDAQAQSRSWVHPRPAPAQTYPIPGEGRQNGQPVCRPAAGFSVSATAFITMCGDITTKVVSLKACASNAGRGELRRALGQSMGCTASCGTAGCPEETGGRLLPLWGTAPQSWDRPCQYGRTGAWGRSQEPRTPGASMCLGTNTAGGTAGPQHYGGSHPAACLSHTPVTTGTAPGRGEEMGVSLGPSPPQRERGKHPEAFSLQRGRGAQRGKGGAPLPLRQTRGR